MTKTYKKKGVESYSFLYSLIKRSTIFLILFLAAMILLYFSGNFQFFLDSSLRIILFCSSLTSVMLFFFSIIGFISSLIMVASTRKISYAIDSILYILIAIAAAAVFISLRGLAVLTSGIH